MGDFTHLPGPEGAGSWWPIAMIGLSMLVSIASAVWATIDRMMSARADRELEAERARQDALRGQADRQYELKVEQLRLDFERQKDFQQDLIEELRAERQHSKDLSEANRVCRETVMARDNEIRERDRVIAALERKIAELERKIEALTKHVATLEGGMAGGTEQ